MGYCDRAWPCTGVFWGCRTRYWRYGEGVGNIMFEPPEGEGYGPQPGYQTMWPYTPDYVLGFLYIEQPDKVQQIIEKARLGGRR